MFRSPRPSSPESDPIDRAARISERLVSTSATRPVCEVARPAKGCPETSAFTRAALQVAKSTHLWRARGSSTGTVCPTGGGPSELDVFVRREKGIPFDHVRRLFSPHGIGDRGHERRELREGVKSSLAVQRGLHDVLGAFCDFGAVLRIRPVPGAVRGDPNWLVKDDLPPSGQRNGGKGEPDDGADERFQDLDSPGYRQGLFTANDGYRHDRSVKRQGEAHERATPVSHAIRLPEGFAITASPFRADAIALDIRGKALRVRE